MIIKKTNVPVADLERHAVERFKHACRGAGVKITHQRLVILREAIRRRDHPDAEAIFCSVRRRLPTISRDTVYRTLWFLRDLGLVTVLGPGRESLRFDTNIRAHHHFTCVRCGAVHDFENGTFDRLTAPAEASAFGRAEKVQVEFRGVCRKCEKMK